MVRSHEREGLEKSMDIFKMDKVNPFRFYVYKLVNPITQKCFYIGKGCGKRAWQHTADAKGGEFLML